MERLLVVDGSNLLFQMFFGMPARIVNSRGKAIQGTLGFVGALLKVIRMVEPTHVAVLFDGDHEHERAALDPGYKANRVDYGSVPEAENPFSQLNDVYDALDYLGIRHAEAATCEADDLIAGYALTFGKEMEVVISSMDSDFFQLVTDRVSVLRYRGRNTAVCTPESIRKRFGVAPEQYADFKSLTGDPSDHIKGADRVGPKTAAAPLGEFGSLEAILAHGDAIRKPSVRDSILRSAEKLRTNSRIIQLDNTAPLPLGLNELGFVDGGLTTGEVLRGIGLAD